MKKHNPIRNIIPQDFRNAMDGLEVKTTKKFPKIKCKINKSGSGLVAGTGINWQVGKGSLQANGMFGTGKRKGKKKRKKNPRAINVKFQKKGRKRKPTTKQTKADAIARSNELRENFNRGKVIRPIINRYTPSEAGKWLIKNNLINISGKCAKLAVQAKYHGHKWTAKDWNDITRFIQGHVSEDQFKHMGKQFRLTVPKEAPSHPTSMSVDTPAKEEENDLAVRHMAKLVVQTGAHKKNTLQEMVHKIYLKWNIRLNAKQRRLLTKYVKEYAQRE